MSITRVKTTPFDSQKSGTSGLHKKDAADSWSIKSDYGSTLDDDQRHADAANIRAPSDYNSDKEEPDSDGEGCVLSSEMRS